MNCWALTNLHQGSKSLANPKPPNGVVHGVPRVPLAGGFPIMALDKTHALPWIPIIAGHDSLSLTSNYIESTIQQIVIGCHHCAATIRDYMSDNLYLLFGSRSSQVTECIVHCQVLNGVKHHRFLVNVRSFSES